MEGVKVVSDRRVYFRSDFDFRLHLKDCRGEDIGWPECDWVATFRTRRSPFPVVASVRGGVAENCWNDGGVIHVVADGHRLLPGVLEMEFVALVPDESYPDGRRSVGAVCALDIELTRESDLCVEDVEVEAMLPCLKGDPLRYEDLTDEQRRDLMAPVMEVLAGELSPVLGERTSVESDEEFEARTGFAREDMKKDLFIDLWNAACSLGVDPIGRPLGSCGCFNLETRLFALNGYTDIDWDEALEIYRLYNGVPKWYCGLGGCQRRPVRTLFPIRPNNSNKSTGVLYTDFSHVNVRGLKKIVFLNYSAWKWSGFQIDGLNNSITNADLEEVGTEFSPLDFAGLSSWNGFYDAVSLREFRIINCKISINLNKSAGISKMSLAFLVSNAANKSTITITVHPDVYAKLTDEGNAEWYQILLDAAERNIQFATV